VNSQGASLVFHAVGEREEVEVEVSWYQVRVSDPLDSRAAGRRRRSFWRGRRLPVGRACNVRVDAVGREILQTIQVGVC